MSEMSQYAVHAPPVHTANCSTGGHGSEGGHAAQCAAAYAAAFETRNEAPRTLAAVPQPGPQALSSATSRQSLSAVQLETAGDASSVDRKDA